jgi:hypothetical protein
VSSRRSPRLLLDNDGHNLFSTLTTDYRRDIDDEVAACASNITTYLLCCGAGRMYFPSQAGGVDPRCRQLIREHERGHDPFGYFLERLRATGRETFITMRMNDVHEPTAADGWNLPTVREQHPDCIVDPAAVARGDLEWMNWGLDFARPEVKRWAIGIVRELVDRYPVDGIQLDWMRFPRHLGGSPEEVWQQRTHLSDVVRAARDVTKAKGLKLTVRIPTSLAGCRSLGVDLAEWVKCGWVDFVSTSPFLTTDFVQPIEEMRAAFADTVVPIYAGFDFEHGVQRHNPESLRAVFTGLYGSGADGIYVFNFPCWRQTTVATPYHWLEGMHEPEQAARMPMLFSVPQHWHRKHVDLPGVLPVVVPALGEVTVTLELPAAALPVRRAMLLISGSQNCDVELNGAAVEWLPGLKGAEIFVEYTGLTDAPGRRDSHGVCRSYRCDPHGLKAGVNQLRFTSRPGSDSSEIKRINLGLW